MLKRFKSQPLYFQLIAPIIIVGLIGIFSVVFSASRLNASVNELEAVYGTSDKKLKSIGDLEVSVSRLRALSLKHLASESYRSMSEISKEFEAVSTHASEQLLTLVAADAMSEKESKLTNDSLSPGVQTYVENLLEVLKLSTDFEKEAAFIRLTHTENQYLPIVNVTLQELKHLALDSINSLRTGVVVNAAENVSSTIAMGMTEVALMTLIAFIVIRRITRRIDNILAWSHEVSSGKLNAPLVVGSNDEVGRLTSSMQWMARNIKQAHDELDDAKNQAESVAEKLQLYAKAFDNSGEAMLISDENNRIVNVNSAFTSQTGFSKDEVLGEDPKIFASGETAPQVYQEMWQELANKDFWQGEIWDCKKSGEVYPKWIRISALRGSQGDVQFYTASFSDISDRKESEARIEHLAHHDILTGLLNRFSLEERLEQAIVTASRAQQNIALLFMDLDRFKSINDSLGHQVGDAVLKGVAERLKDCVRESDIVARIGGDEFIIALTNISGTSYAASISEILLQKISVPYHLGDQTVDISPSIGISIYPDDGSDVDGLMRSADMAMYHAKENGRSNYQYFDKIMLDEANTLLRTERELRDALASDELLLYYQPQVTSTESKLISFEALVRWNHPRDGIVPPCAFISVAEDTGLIYELGRWVFNESCRQLADWNKSGVVVSKIAINLSTKQLQLPTLAAELEEIMDRHGVSGNEIELEVTESVAMSDPELSVKQLHALRELGFSLAIDDFGTGYSSLAYLKRLPIDTLKLDKSFVRDIESDVNDAEICSATVTLAHNLGLKVVAEGVETEAQRVYLQRIGCDYLQGYMFSKPMPADKAGELIVQ